MGEMAGFTDKFDSFTVTELNELLEDDTKLDSIVQEMDEMQEVQQVKELTLASNRSLAEQNLQLQPNLDLQKNQLTKRYRHLQDLYDDYQLRKSTLDQSSGNSSLDTLLALLQAEGAKIEEETENMADSFLDGDLTLDGFMDDYQRKRLLAHLRRVKIDKLREQVLNGLTQPPQTISASVPPAQPGRPQDFPTSPSPYTNGSPSPLPERGPPPPSSQPIALPYPACPYPSSLPSLSAYNSSSYMPQPYMPQPYTPTPPQHSSPHLSPRTGFIMQ